MNEIKTIGYGSFNVPTTSYVALGSKTTIETNKLLVSDSSGQLMKLAVDDGSSIPSVAASLVDQTITYSSLLPGAEGNATSIELDDPGVASSPLSVSVTGEAIDVSLETSGPIAATASLATTTPIVFTSVAAGAARNTNTIHTVVSAAAANPTDTILVGFTGTSAAIIVTITPNDGTNNGTVPVNLTAANLTQLINTGLVTGKTVTITDLSTLRILQTATGGGSSNLAHSGQGDGLTATFSGGLDYALISTAQEVVDAIAADLVASGLVSGVAGTPSQILTALVQTYLSGGTDAAQSIVDLFQLPVDDQAIVPLPSSATIPIGSQLYLEAVSAKATSGFCAVTLLS